MDNLPELGTLLMAVFGALGTILIGFYRYAQSRERDFEKSRALAAKEYSKSTKALTTSLNRVARATERAADEAKMRNGHLAELQLQGHQMIQEVIFNVKNQSVEHQTIKNSIVENETITNKE